MKFIVEKMTREYNENRKQRQPGGVLMIYSAKNKKVKIGNTHMSYGVFGNGKKI
jgi:hypothetical protein